jgi:hypothetical protein
MGSLPNPTDWLVMVRNEVVRLRGESLPVRGDDSSELRLYFILLDVDEEIESRLRSVNGARAGGRKATVLISREEDWRGRKTVYDVQSSVLRDRTRYFASRLVYAPEYGGAWYLESDARDSAEHAQQLLVELEDAVTLQ